MSYLLNRTNPILFGRIINEGLEVLVQYHNFQSFNQMVSTIKVDSGDDLNTIYSRYIKWCNE